MLDLVIVIGSFIVFYVVVVSVLSAGAIMLRALRYYDESGEAGRYRRRREVARAKRRRMGG